MARVSKNIIEGIVKFLLKEKRTNFNKKQEEFTSFFTESYLETLPQDLLVFYDTNLGKKYLNLTSSLRVSGNGFNYEYINTNRQVPSENGFNFLPQEELAKKLLDKRNELDLLRKEYDELQRELLSVLQSLSTDKNIIKEFPETQVYFTKNNTCTQLVPNLQLVKDRLKS